MAEVKWIKIVTDIFDDEKMLLIESLPSADSLIVIWFKLLCLAGKNNNDGVFLMNDRIPYTDEMLATIFRRDINTVRLALDTFERFGMIEIINGVITIPNWGKHQALDSYERRKERDRIYQAERRAKQKQLAEKSVDASDDSSSDVGFSDKNRLEGDKNRLEEESILPAKETKHTYGEYNHVRLTDTEFNNLCRDYGDIETKDAIQFLDEYIEMKGYKAKSHYLCIRKWVFDAVKEHRAKENKANKSIVDRWANA